MFSTDFLSSLVLPFQTGKHHLLFETPAASYTRTCAQSLFSAPYEKTKELRNVFSGGMTVIRTLKDQLISATVYSSCKVTFWPQFLLL